MMCGLPDAFELCILVTFWEHNTHICSEIATALRTLMRSSLSSSSGEFIGHIGQDPSVSKSNRLHVVIFRFCFLI